MNIENCHEAKWKFRYVVYKKQQAIQLKPTHNKHIHFSLVWFSEKVSPEIFQQVENLVREWLINHHILRFTILRVCANCTYGRFDDEFESFILHLRDIYPLARKKDLPLDDVNHSQLKERITWDEDHPIMHHISSRPKMSEHNGINQEDQDWLTIMRNEDERGIFERLVLCHIEFE